MSEPFVTPGPEALRALAHPVRLRMLGMLRVDGPDTASGLGRRLDLNTGATSYHLRQLARHGFIEEDAERGNGRERWWRAVHASTRTPRDEAGVEPADLDARDAYLQAVATTHTELLGRAVAQQRRLPQAWREAATFSDWVLRLTPARAAELREAMVGLLTEFAEDAPDTPDALPWTVNVNAYLNPDAGDDLLRGDAR
ncbi:winged helix-turn-helix domain-containing protein [Intrasporangium flavum]|uniref:winged helix-turn-helix domain-containing protein n=1 Tax=Intrasporangium flavum TaxID=1428657 RepID=UPI00096E5842|nr:helix-turn-helix domain-containing protein [Intrasporangium flavum]